MESLPVRRKSCLLRIRENCPFRKLRKHTYDVSAAASSAIGSYWNNLQPISTAYSEPRPPLPGCQSDQSQPDVHMEEDPPAARNLQHLQHLQNLENLQHLQNLENLESLQHLQNLENPQNLENLQHLQNRAEDCMELENAIDPETGERAQR